MKPLCSAALAALGAAVAKLGRLPPAASTAAWWRARIGFGDRDLDREIASALAKHVGALPSSAKPVAKPKTKPAPVVVDDDDDDEDPDTDDDEPEDTAPVKPKKLKHVDACYELAAHEFAMAKPTAREGVLKAIGMSPADAIGISDADLIRLAPSHAAMTKGSRR